MDLATVALIVLVLLFFACISAIALAECEPILPQYRSHVAHPVMAVPTHHHPQIQQTILTTQSVMHAFVEYARNSRQLGTLIRMVHTVISHARLIRLPPIYIPAFAAVEMTNPPTSAGQASFNPTVIEPSFPAQIHSGQRLSNSLVLDTTLISGVYLPSSSSAIDIPTAAITVGSPSTPQQSETSLSPSVPSSSTYQPLVH